MYPTVPGQPQYSGVFIPEIWSTNMLTKYYDSTVLSVISNTDYEGEIKTMGDKVIIRTMPTMDIHEYQIGQTLQHQRPVGGRRELMIDKGFYWSAILDNVVEVQQDIDQMKLWAEDASEQMKLRLDTKVLGSIVPDIDPANVGTQAGRISRNINLGGLGAPLQITRSNILEIILYMGQVLDEQNVEETGRFLLLPYWATTLIKLSPLGDAGFSGDATSMQRNGMVGTIDRFTVYNVNHLPMYQDGADRTTHFIAGTKKGITFATQLTNTRSLEAESTFGRLMQGLMVYGFEVLYGQCLTAAYVTKA